MIAAALMPPNHLHAVVRQTAFGNDLFQEARKKVIELVGTPRQKGVNLPGLRNAFAR
jgi:hypothetical protein